MPGSVVDLDLDKSASLHSLFRLVRKQFSGRIVLICIMIGCDHLDRWRGVLLPVQQTEDLLTRPEMDMAVVDLGRAALSSRWRLVESV